MAKKQAIARFHRATGDERFIVILTLESGSSSAEWAYFHAESVNANPVLVGNTETGWPAPYGIDDVLLKAHKRGVLADWGGSTFVREVTFTFVDENGDLTDSEEPKDPPKSLRLLSPSVVSTLESFINGAVMPSGTSDPQATPAAPAKPKKKRNLKGIPRPSGEVYLPRKFKDTTDVEFMRDAKKAGLFILIGGAPGGGKTACAEAAHGRMTTVVLDQYSTRSDLVGEGYFRADGTTAYHEGPLIQSWIHRHDSQCESDCARNVLYLDEVNLARSNEISVLHAAMDGRTVLRTIEHGALERSPDFYVIGTINPDVPGAMMSPALLSRFHIHMDWETDYDIALKLGVPDVIVQVAKNLAVKKANQEPIGVLPSMRDLLAFKRVAETFDTETAWQNFLAKADPLDADIYHDVASADAGFDIKPLALLAAGSH